MSDLEKVMERLLADALFQSALARDPQMALAGYTLTAEDRELLGVPLVSGDVQQRTVETRTTKSSMAGLLGPVLSAFGGGSQTVGSAPGSGAIGSAPVHAFGYAPQADGVSLGDAPTPTQSFGSAGPSETFGAATSTDTMGVAPTGPTLPPYATRIDVDGDGNWDAHTVLERPDGGVDLHADMNNDGVVDFVGHDDNRDGLVDSAEFDYDRDGVMDTRMYDDNGDGWMDRSEAIPPGTGQSFGPGTEQR